MKKIYSFFLLFLLCTATAMAQISVTATVGTTGPTTYTTLKGAFDAINLGTHKGAITISINGNTTETATASLDSSAGASSYTSVAINATGAFTINSNITTATVLFNGADNVNLNGAGSLQIVNTNAQGPVISFIRDATGNTVRNTIIKGATAVFTGTSSAPVITSGVVFFGTGTVAGNDNNTIDNCDIDGNNSAISLLFCNGSNTSPNILNSGNMVKNSRFRNYINGAIGGAQAIFIGNATNWTIQDNSIYQTTPVSTSQQFIYRGILVVPAFTGDFHTVTGNYFGGNAPAAAGMMDISASASNALGFIGIDVETGGPGNLVSNNTVKNINFSYTSDLGSFTNAGIFGFIGGYNGTTTFSGNTVSNLTIANNNGYIAFQAMHFNGRVTAANSIVAPSFTISNNTVNAINVTSGGTAGDIQVYGIRLETSSSTSLTTTSTAKTIFIATGNTVSNISAAFAGTATFIRGIGTVASNGTQTTPSTAVLIPKVTISGNAIHSLTTSSALANYAAPACVGIHFSAANGGTNTTDTARLNENTIYNLSATNTADVGVVVTGILGTTGIMEMTRNKVYDLRNAASGAAVSPAPGIVGLNMRRNDGTANSLIANNFVSLGTSVTNNLQIFGILNNFVTATGSPLNVLYNTVVVTGAGAGGNNKITAAYYRGTEAQAGGVGIVVVLKNNILYNARTGGGAHYAVANTNSPAATGFTSDYNNLYSTNAATIALWGSTANTLAVYKANSGDVNSVSVPVSFVNIATGDLHLAGASITDASLKAVPVGGITTDFDNDARSATTPTMGADEGVSCAAPAITAQPTNQSACTGSSATFNVTATGAGLTYQWRKAGVNISGATASSYTIATTAAGDAASYDVVITGTCGNITSNSVTLTLNAAPVISSQPSAQSVCAGSSASFTVVASGSGLTYQWRKAGVNINGATSATYTIPAVAAGDAGNYDVVITTSCATTATSNTVALSLNTATTISTQPAATQTICAGANVSFSVVAAGSGTLTYQWRKGTTNIAGATAATYTITGATAAAAGTDYNVVVTGACGSVTSANAALVVNPATIITTQPASQTVCAGATASFTATATGTGTITYQWKKAGVDIAGATSATYPIVNVTTANAGVYTVVATGSCGSVTSNGATLTVNTGGSCPTALPGLDADVTAARLMPNVVRDQTIIRLQARRSMKIDWTVTDANGRVVMQFGRQVSSGQNDIRLTVSGLASGSYILTGTTAKGRTAILRFVKP